MSQSSDKEASDDEFQDALSNLGLEKSNEDIIEEIIKKQENVTLDDVPKALGVAEGGDEEGAASHEETVENQEYDTDDEAALIEMEKVLTEPEMKLRREHAVVLKEMGNEQFRNGELEKAIETYSTALQICPTTEHKDRAMLLSNRAAAKIKIDAKQAAIKDCNKAITLWPEYVRAILRRAKVYHDTDKLDEALQDFELVYKLDPGNLEAREAMVRLPPMIQERNEKMKEEVLDKLKDLGDMILKPFGLSTSNFQMQKDSATGGYSINFNQNKS